MSNTSPIINLAAIGQLHLLEQLYGRILIPQGVYHEIVIVGAGQAGAAEVQTFSWIETRQVVNQGLATSLLADLDKGEAEAIALAVELDADLLLMDERLGRTVALRSSLNVVGLLGVLVEAKKRAMISVVQPMLDDLRAKAGFRIASQLYAQVLQAAGE